MIISLVIIYIFAITMAIFFRKKTVECIPISIFGIVFILYIFGIVNLFIIGLLILIILALLCIIYILYNIISKKINIFNFIDIGSTFFFGMVILMYYITKESQIICYDEFTAWGMFVKSSLESKALYIYSEFQVHAKQYASGTSIFQIFSQFCNFTFSEDLLFISMDMIYFSMAINIMKNLKWQNIIEAIFRSCIILIIPLSIYMWPSFYYTILVDVILGFTFGYILFSYFTNGLNKFNFLNVSLSVFFITCTKGNGLILGLMALCIIYLDLILLKKKEVFNYINLNQYKNFFKTVKFKNLLVLLLPIFTIIFTFLSWNICIKILGISSYSNGELNNVFSSIFSKEFYEKIITFIDVLKNLLKEYESFILIIYALLFSVVLFDFKASKKNIIKKFIVFITYILLNILYILFLFAVCNTMITIAIAIEALRRYLLTLVAANLFVSLFFLIWYGTKKVKISFSIVILMIIYTSTPASWQIKKFINEDYTNESIEYRKNYEVINKKLKIVDADKDVVYYIREIEGDIYLSNFSVFPIQLSFMPQFTKDLTIEEYSSLLLNRSNINLFKTSTENEKNKLLEKKDGKIYIFIYKVTENNILDYGKFFEYNNIPMLDETLYLIENKNNIATLTIIE